MSDNVRTIRTGITPSADPEREILIHLQEKLAVMKAEGIEPKGIVFVLFGVTEDGKEFSSAHWMTEYMQNQGGMVAAYAAMKLQQEIFE